MAFPPAPAAALNLQLLKEGEKKSVFSALHISKALSLTKGRINQCLDFKFLHFKAVQKIIRFSLYQA